MLVTAVACIGTATPVQAFHGDPWYGADPGPYSALRGYYTYIDISSQSGESGANSLADGLDFYYTWVGSAPNYATSIYMGAYAESLSAEYYDLADLTEAYYLMSALYYYQYFASLGYQSYAYDYFNQLAYGVGYASSSQYYDLADEVYDVYGHNTDMFGNPTGLAAYYAYIFDQLGF